MKRTAILVPALAASLALTGCSKSASTDASSAATGASSAGAAASSNASGAASSADTAAAGSPTATGTATPSGCPTDNTRAFPKTRFVADVGLAAGTFHRWIYKPYQDGKFKQGADGRTMAIAKAVGTAALDAKLIGNAYENVSADPALCKVLKAPLGKLKGTLDTMKTQVTHGDMSSIAAAQSVLGTVMGDSQQQGMKITETTDTSTAK